MLGLPHALHLPNLPPHLPLHLCPVLAHPNQVQPSKAFLTACELSAIKKKTNNYMSPPLQPTNKKLLYEVSIIRPTIIFLLVVLHAFAHVERWIVDGVVYSHESQPVVAYQWFCSLISGFRIETIALIAGYVFAYQSLDLNRSYKFWPFVVK